MEFTHYDVCCPLIPLFPRGEKYPANYALPPRMRPLDCLNLPKLTNILRDSVLYEDKKKTATESDSEPNVSVVSVLSPYSFEEHVMIMDLNPHLYLPSPEKIERSIFNKISNLVIRCIDILRKRHTKCLCAGYNWSPYSYGTYEEKCGGQSITTKFHFSVWCWNTISEYDKSKELTKEKLMIMGDNKYGKIFANLIFQKLEKLLKEFSLFDEENAVFGSNCLFIPFRDDVTINDCLIDRGNGNFVQNAATIISDVLNKISEILCDEKIENLFEILKQTEKRPLNDNEIKELRQFPNIFPLEECLKKCNDDLTKELIKEIYPLVVNRKNETPGSMMWKKNFAYSLSLSESSLDHIKSGLRIALLAQIGHGGMIEPFGCVLTRPENSLANEDVMMKHNNLLWDLADQLSHEI